MGLKKRMPVRAHDKGKESSCRCYVCHRSTREFWVTDGITGELVGLCRRCYTDMTDVRRDE